MSALSVYEVLWGIKAEENLIRLYWRSRERERDSLQLSCVPPLFNDVIVGSYDSIMFLKGQKGRNKHIYISIPCTTF